MSIEAETTRVEPRRVDAQVGAGSGIPAVLDDPHRGRIPGREEDAAADAVTRTAAPIIVAVLTMIAVAVVGIGTWSWIDAR
jgi:hypothetical protein